MENVFSSLFEQALEQAQDKTDPKHTDFDTVIRQIADSMNLQPCRIVFEKPFNSSQSSLEISGSALSLMAGAVAIVSSVNRILSKSGEKAGKSATNTMLGVFASMVMDALRDTDNSLWKEGEHEPN